MIEPQPSTVSCWSCCGPVVANATFCGTCAAIQPPRTCDRFRILGFDVQFDMDAAELERRYFSRQRELHPDRFAAKSAREREYAMQHTANLNEAFTVLNSPVKRAEILLDTLGYPVRRSGDETVANEEVLLDAMEMRERLADAETVAAVDIAIGDSVTKTGDCIAALSGAFEANNVEAALLLTMRLTYLDKFGVEARERRLRLEAT